MPSSPCLSPAPAPDSVGAMDSRHHAARKLLLALALTLPAAARSSAALATATSAADAAARHSKKLSENSNEARRGDTIMRRTDQTVFRVRRRAKVCHFFPMPTAPLLRSLTRWLLVSAALAAISAAQDTPARRPSPNDVAVTAPTDDELAAIRREVATYRQKIGDKAGVPEVEDKFVPIPKNARWLSAVEADHWVDQRLQLLDVAGCNAQMAAFFGKGLGCGGADAFGGSGDESDFTGEFESGVGGGGG
eukprot:gene24733-32213_t